MSLNSDIKTIIQNLTPETIYLRAATLNEANVELPQITIDKPIAIHAALPTITNTQNQISVDRLIPVQVLFLQKNTSQDDDGEQIDAILDGLLPLVDQFYSDLRKTVDSNLDIETYTLDAIPAYQFSDEVLTGWSLELQYPKTIPSICYPEKIEFDFLPSEAGWSSFAATPVVFTWLLNAGWQQEILSSVGSFGIIIHEEPILQGLSIAVDVEIEYEISGDVGIVYNVDFYSQNIKITSTPVSNDSVGVHLETVRGKYLLDSDFVGVGTSITSNPNGAQVKADIRKITISYFV